MKWLDRLEEGVVTLMLAAMTLLTFVQVVLRYAFNTGFGWALELTGVFFAVMIFIGISYGVRVGAHIGVDALVKAFGKSTQRAVAIVATLVCIAYAAIFAFGGYQYVRKMYEVGILMQDMPIAQWIPRIILPLGFALLTFRFAQVLWRLASGKEAHLVGDEAEEVLRQNIAPTDQRRP